MRTGSGRNVTANFSQRLVRISYSSYLYLANIIVFQYDRTDPNDIQALKDEIDDLQIDLRRAGEERESMTKEIETQTKKVSILHIERTQ